MDERPDPADERLEKWLVRRANACQTLPRGYLSSHGDTDAEGIGMVDLHA